MARPAASPAGSSGQPSRSCNASARHASSASPGGRAASVCSSFVVVAGSVVSPRSSLCCQVASLEESGPRTARSWFFWALGPSDRNGASGRTGGTEVRVCSLFVGRVVPRERSRAGSRLLGSSVPVQVAKRLVLLGTVDSCTALGSRRSEGAVPEAAVGR
ncbi:hypothetical protein NDU88_009053 [Pleurodeles waltl]|uniref:Uncharacterized protein n=1 Tax=Pleurodeles waltl TaxID=8319 RepID=A0AAV7RU61_PLEWA|nr:hypothetical protein NDU88_009053 [Pleurodeles waltl]